MAQAYNSRNWEAIWGQPELLNKLTAKLGQRVECLRRITGSQTGSQHTLFLDAWKRKPNPKLLNVVVWMRMVPHRFMFEYLVLCWWNCLERLGGMVLSEMCHWKRSLSYHSSAMPACQPATMGMDSNLWNCESQINSFFYQLPCPWHLFTRENEQDKSL